MATLTLPKPLVQESTTPKISNLQTPPSEKLPEDNKEAPFVPSNLAQLPNDKLEELPVNNSPFNPWGNLNTATNVPESPIALPQQLASQPGLDSGSTKEGQLPPLGDSSDSISSLVTDGKKSNGEKPEANLSYTIGFYPHAPYSPDLATIDSTTPTETFNWSTSDTLTDVGSSEDEA